MDEPGFLLRAVTWHIGSGDALFVAFGLLTFAACLQARGNRFLRSLLVTILAIVWLTLAAWPTTNRHFYELIVIALLWVIGSHFYLANRADARKRRYGLCGTLCLFIALLCGFELAWHQPLRSLAPTAESVAIIGDSVTAGLNATDVTWPRQLTQSSGRTIYDASQQGATVKSAFTQLEKLNGRGDLLWIEIGGNDILESLPVDIYAERLEALLQSAREKYRHIVMMEIPAPPGGGGYGNTQRTLATKYHIPLVPKRQFLWVLTSAGSTQDGVHLANAGHQRMASLVQKTLGWADAQQPGDYQRVE